MKLQTKLTQTKIRTMFRILNLCDTCWKAMRKFISEQSWYNMGTTKCLSIENLDDTRQFKV